MAKKSKTVAAQAVDTPVDGVKIVAYKGFDKNMQCRGYQFEVGKTYEHEGPVKSCESGFHACKHPLSIFEFYAPGQSRYAKVKLTGPICDKETTDTKIAGAKISIEVELSISDLVKRAWDYVWSRATVEGEVATGDYGAASSTGDQGAASSTGKDAAAMACGYEGRVSGADGCALFLAERNSNYEIVSVWAGIAGRDGIKPNTFYTLKGGTPVEVP